MLCLCATLVVAPHAYAGLRKTAVGSISGTVTTHSGMALPLAKLDLLCNDQVVRTAEADSEGFYAFKDLEEGLYMVKASAGSYKPVVSNPIKLDKEHDLEICNLCVMSEHPVHYKLSYKFDVKCADTPLIKQVDSILVLKSKREMLVFNSKELLKVYHVSLGEIPVGPKHFEGDLKTPEGLYYINDKNPHSEAHKNLGISYPNDADRAYAKSRGKPTGGDVKIHGQLNGFGGDKTDYQGSDWTWGCIGVLDEEIDELFTHVPVGIPINILP